MADWAVSASIRAIDKLSGVFHGMGDALGKFGSRGGDAFDHVNKKASLFKTILGGVVAGGLITTGINAVGRGIKSMVESIPEFAERGDEIERVSKTLGLSADTFQRLSYAAKLTDTPVESVQAAMQKLNMAMGQGQRGMGPLIQQMAKLNPQLAMQLRNTRDSKTAFLLVADAVSKTSNVQARAALEVAAFGKAGQGMNAMLAEGRPDEKLMREASIYGTVLDEKAIKNSISLADNLKRLKGTVQSIKDQVLSFVVTAIGPYIERLVQWIAANKEIIAQRFEGFLERLTTGFRDLWPVISTLFKGVGWLIRNWPLLGAVYLAWIAAQIALNVAMDANIIGLITLAIEGLIVEVLIVIKYWHEITSALEGAWNWFNRLLGNPWIKLGLSLIAEPLLVIVAVIQTIVDLIQGRGISSFRNLIKAAGPLGLIGSMLGWDKTGANAGNIAGSEQAPNKGMTPFQFINQINVDNSRAPGTTSAVRASPRITANPGIQWGGAY